MQPAASNRTGGKIFECEPVAGNAGGSGMLDVEIPALEVVVESSSAGVAGRVGVVVVAATVVVVVVGATVVVEDTSDDATVVVVTSGAVVVGTDGVVVVVVVAGTVVVVGSVVVVGATVVVVVEVVVVVVVVGTACHWAYRVKSAVWLCAVPAVIWVPLEVAVYQPVNV